MPAWGCNMLVLALAGMLPASHCKAGAVAEH